MHYYRLFCSTNTSARYYVEKTGEKNPYRGKTTQASAQPWQSGTLICSCQSSIMLCTCGLLRPSHHMSHSISSNSIFFLESFEADQFLQAKLCLGQWWQWLPIHHSSKFWTVHKQIRFWPCHKQNQSSQGKRPGELHHIDDVIPSPSHS